MAARKTPLLEKIHASLESVLERDLSCERTAAGLSARLYLFGDVDTAMAKRVCQQLDTLQRSNLSELTVYFHTDGGDVDSGMAIYQSLKFLSANAVKVKGVVRGTCQSVGLVILQACTQRLAVPTAVLMHHRGYTVAERTLSPEEAMETAAFEKRHMDIVDRLIFEKVKKTYVGGGATFEQFQRDGARSVYMTAEEALKHGFLDAIVEG